jgi:hypothetical protein
MLTAGADFARFDPHAFFRHLNNLRQKRRCGTGGLLPHEHTAIGLQHHGGAGEDGDGGVSLLGRPRGASSSPSTEYKRMLGRPGVSEQLSRAGGQTGGFFPEEAARAKPWERLTFTKTHCFYPAGEVSVDALTGKTTSVAYRIRSAKGNRSDTCWNCHMKIPPTGAFGDSWGGMPIAIGREPTGEYTAMGYFCTPGCAFRYIDDRGDKYGVRFTTQALTRELYRVRYGIERPERIVSAPPVHMLDHLGGDMTIDQYRRAGTARSRVQFARAVLPHEAVVRHNPRVLMGVREPSQASRAAKPVHRMVQANIRRQEARAKGSIFTKQSASKDDAERARVAAAAAAKRAEAAVVDEGDADMPGAVEKAAEEWEDKVVDPETKASELKLKREARVVRTYPNTFKGVRSALRARTHPAKRRRTNSAAPPPLPPPPPAEEVDPAKMKPAELRKQQHLANAQAGSAQRVISGQRKWMPQWSSRDKELAKASAARRRAMQSAPDTPPPPPPSQSPPRPPPPPVAGGGITSFF